MLIAEYPHHAELIRAFRANWWEMIPGPIDENVAIVDDLIDSGIDVTALTNWAPDTFIEAEAQFPILRRFRGITVSGRIGMIKPDAAIYRHHARTFGLSAGEHACSSTTIRPTSKPHASWVGNAELYVSTDTLRTDLSRYKVAP